jgi:hypothetical protein
MTEERERNSVERDTDGLVSDLSHNTEADFVSENNESLSEILKPGPLVESAPVTEEDLEDIDRRAQLVRELEELFGICVTAHNELGLYTIEDDHSLDKAIILEINDILYMSFERKFIVLRAMLNRESRTPEEVQELLDGLNGTSNPDVFLTPEGSPEKNRKEFDRTTALIMQSTHLNHHDLFSYYGQHCRAASLVLRDELPEVIDQFPEKFKPAIINGFADKLAQLEALSEKSLGVAKRGLFKLEEDVGQELYGSLALAQIHRPHPAGVPTAIEYFFAEQLDLLKQKRQEVFGMVADTSDTEQISSPEQIRSFRKTFASYLKRGKFEAVDHDIVIGGNRALRPAFSAVCFLLTRESSGTVDGHILRIAKRKVILDPEGGYEDAQIASDGSTVSSGFGQGIQRIEEIENAVDCIIGEGTKVTCAIKGRMSEVEKDTFTVRGVGVLRL